MAKTKDQETPTGGPPQKGQALKLAAGSGNLPTSIFEKVKEDVGKGVSTDQADNLVPIVAIAQPLTPQAMASNPKKIEGLEPGMIWLKNAPGDIQFIPGEDGILVQPCFFDKDFVEWRTRDNGGGFIARWRAIVKKPDPQDANKTNLFLVNYDEKNKEVLGPQVTEVRDPKNQNKIKWVLQNGNEVVETRYHIVRVFMDDGRRLAYTIPFASTGHTVSRGWMTQMNLARLPEEAGGGNAPSFAKLYRMKLGYKTNAAGAWWQWTISDEGWIASVDDYEAGRNLFNAFEKGEKKIDEGGLGEGAGNDGEQAQNTM